jgi:hypothetical protein
MPFALTAIAPLAVSGEPVTVNTPGIVNPIDPMPPPPPPPAGAAQAPSARRKLVVPPPEVEVNSVSSVATVQSDAAPGLAELLHFTLLAFIGASIELVSEPEVTEVTLLLPTVVTMPVNAGCRVTKSAAKFALVFWNAVRMGSPVPSLAATPTLMTCCASACYAKLSAVARASNLFNRIRKAP